MEQFKCVCFQTDSGRVPVQEFIDSLHQRTQQKCFNVIDLLKEFGKKLPVPHADYLGDDIYELRFTGVEGRVRILYFFYYEDKIVLTNGFVKKRQRTPKTEIETAKIRRGLYLAKMKNKT
jgi:phage-related protein